MSSVSALLPLLATVARRARAGAGASTTEVALAAHVDPSTVRRFETARAWPRDPDALIGAYARITRRKPRELWREAVDQWNPA
jgi:hypothetical protein